MLEAQQELSAVPLKEELEPSRVALWGPLEVLLGAPSPMHSTFWFSVLKWIAGLDDLCNVGQQNPEVELTHQRNKPQYPHWCVRQALHGRFQRYMCRPYGQCRRTTATSLTTSVDMYLHYDVP